MSLFQCFALAGLLAGSWAAQASTYDFSASTVDGSFSGSGVLTASANGNGSYTVEGISGPGVTGLLDAGMFQGNDNLIFPGEPLLVDSHGFAFGDTMGDTSYVVDLYDSASGYEVSLVDSDGFSQMQPITFGPTATEQVQFRLTEVKGTATPEPSSWVLLGTGALGFAGTAVRRLR